MSLGFEQAGIKSAVAIEIDPIHARTYSSNFGHTQMLMDDIRNINGATIRQTVGSHIDILFGGPPCQGFSLIGKRSKNDPRNYLLQEFARLVGEIKPNYFVVENVPGLLYGDAKYALYEFIDRINNFGYSIVEPIKVLNAADFHIPQKRDRVFILGYSNDCLPPKYPSVEISENHVKPTVWDAIGDLPDIDKYPELLTSDVYEGLLGTPSVYATELRKDLRNQSACGAINDQVRLTGCLRTSHTQDVIMRFHNTLPGTQEPISRFHRLSKDGMSLTLRAGTSKDKGSFMAARPIHPIQPRCITVREAARLHSYPDWFTFHHTKWHGFQQVGNSVPPKMAKAVALEIARNLESEYR